MDNGTLRGYGTVHVPIESAAALPYQPPTLYGGRAAHLTLSTKVCLASSDFLLTHLVLAGMHVMCCYHFLIQAVAETQRQDEAATQLL